MNRTVIILVTGAGGFVGGHLMAYLRQSMPDAVLHGTLLNEGERRPALDALRVTLHTADLRDPALVNSLISALKPDYIYHLAGQAFIPRAFEAPWETFEINVRGTLNILEAVKRHHKTARVLVVSSADVYGLPERPTDLQPLTEYTAMRPSNPYSVSKVAQDMLTLQYALAHKVHTIRMRPFNHIGPGQNVRFAVPDWASQIAAAEVGKREPVVYVGNLEAARDFTDVRDVVRAYTLAIAQGLPGEVFNVCSGTPHPMRFILGTLIQLSTVQIDVRIDPERFRPVDIPKLVGDSSHLRERTGWQPHFMLEQTLRDVLEEWRAHFRT